MEAGWGTSPGEMLSLQNPKKQNLHSAWCQNEPSPAPNSAKMRPEQVLWGSQQENRAGTTEPFRKKEAAISSQKPKSRNILC